MNSKTKTILGIIVFVILILGAYFSYNMLSKNYTPTTLEQSDKTKAIDFNIIDINGKNVKLSDFYGKPIVLNFWASWCPPCKMEMPEFNDVYNQSKNDIVFLMVDLTDGQRETKEKAIAYVKSQSFSFPIYFDINQDAAYKYGISSIPTTIFIDKNGYISSGHTGAITKETLQLEIEKIR